MGNGLPEEGDPEKGKRIFKMHCATCHSTKEGGKQWFGPNLHGIIGRKAGSAPGYDKYTEANKNRSKLCRAMETCLGRIILLGYHKDRHGCNCNATEL